MRNEKLLPYETIVQATGGEPEAVSRVLLYYTGSTYAAPPVSTGRMTGKPRTT